MTKAQERIERKNKKKAEPVAATAEAPVQEPGVPGPEPHGLKEKVKQGFLTAPEALQLLEGKVAPGSKIVGWLRRRQHA